MHHIDLSGYTQSEVIDIYNYWQSYGWNYTSEEADYVQWAYTMATMGYGWSYTEYLKGSDTTFQLPEGMTVNIPTREKECRCDSHYLFAFGHEKQCDHYKEKK